MRDQILQYLKEKGWTYKSVDSAKGIQLELKTCPYCQDSKGTHFYINSETGVNYCHLCGAKGSFYSLKKFCGDIIPVSSFSELSLQEPSDDTGEMLLAIESNHQALLQDREALKYLHSRKFSKEAIEYFKLGVEAYNSIKWLWYPSLWHGISKNVKMRSLPPSSKAFRRWSGGESSLFNENVLDEDYKTIFLCEGEGDAVALWSRGIRNVVGVTIGAKGIKSEWVEKLDKYERIYLAYDSDKDGKIGAVKIASRLGLERCYIVSLPEGNKDVNDFFMQGGTKELWDQLVERAAKIDVEHVKPLASVMQDYLVNLDLKIEDSGIDFPWENVTRLAGKMQPGDLWVIASKPKVGKTTFCLNILYHNFKQDIPCLLFELEMRPERMLPRIVALHVHKDSSKLVDEDFTKAYNEMKTYPFYFASDFRKLDWGTISDTIRMCLRRYGIRFVVFDNLHFLGRTRDNMTQQISMMSQNFKLLAEELAIPIILIARPRKLQRDQKEMTTEDLAWTADIEADADAVIILERDEKKIGKSERETVEGVFKPETSIRITRIRYQKGGRVVLDCNDAEARFDVPS